MVFDDAICLGIEADFGFCVSDTTNNAYNTCCRKTTQKFGWFAGVFVVYPAWRDKSWSI